MKKSIKSVIHFAVIFVQLVIILSLILLLNLNLSGDDAKSFIADITGGIIGALIGGIFAIFVVNLQHSKDELKDDIANKENLDVTKQFTISRNFKFSNRVRSKVTVLKKEYFKYKEDYIGLINYFNEQSSKFVELIDETQKIRTEIFIYITHKNISGKELNVLLKVIDLLDNMIDTFEIVSVFQENKSPKSHIYWAIGDYIVASEKYESHITSLKYNN